MCLSVFDMLFWLGKISKRNRTPESITKQKKLYGFFREKFLGIIGETTTGSHMARKQVIDARKMNRKKKNELLKRLKENQDYKDLIECEKMERVYNSQLKKYDHELEERPSLFSNMID